MTVNKRRKNIKEVASNIIINQFEDRKEFGIENHFLVDIINEMVLQQSTKIKYLIDFIFNHNSFVDDKHSMKCTMHLNTEEKSVFSIKDDSLYGPNLDHILIIDDKENGKLHIRQIYKEEELLEYKKNKYSVYGDHYMTRGFLYTYEYMPEGLKFALDSCKDKSRINEIMDIYSNLLIPESMGDRTFELYDKVVYSVGLLSNIKNRIELEKSDRIKNKI